MALLGLGIMLGGMINELIENVRAYQKHNGMEFDPQVILFKLSGCKKCKELETELMVDGWSYESFDCNTDEHADIADILEEQLKSNTYPIVFITYPEPKVLLPQSPILDKKVITNLNPNQSIYKQLTPHLS